jgi:hypothetical protein
MLNAKLAGFGDPDRGRNAAQHFRSIFSAHSMGTDRLRRHFWILRRSDSLDQTGRAAYKALCPRPTNLRLTTFIG